MALHSGVPGGAAPPLTFRPNGGPKGRKKIFGDPPPHPTLNLRVRMTVPPYLKVWIRHGDESQ